MKFFILLAVIASAAAGPVIVNTGASAVSRSDDGLGNYAFGYNEDHATGGTFRKEKGGPGVQVGSYGLRDADGRVRTVNYVADALGYRASISTNEPGVDPAQPAAATTLNGVAPIAPAVAVAAAPIAAYAAPIVAKAAYAAPLAYAAPVAAYAAPAVAVTKTYAAAPIAVAAPIASSYSVATQHVSAAPAVLAAPAPIAVAAAPVAYAAKALIGAPSSYSVATQHVSAAAPAIYAAPAPLAVAAPLITKTYAAAPLAVAAPLATSVVTKTLGAPLGLASGYSYSTGPIIGAPVVAKAAYGAYGAPLAAYGAAKIW